MNHNVLTSWNICTSLEVTGSPERTPSLQVVQDTSELKEDIKCVPDAMSLTSGLSSKCRGFLIISGWSYQIWHSTPLYLTQNHLAMLGIRATSGARITLGYVISLLAINYIDPGLCSTLRMSCWIMGNGSDDVGCPQG